MLQTHKNTNRFCSTKYGHTFSRFKYILLHVVVWDVVVEIQTPNHLTVYV